MNKAEVPVVSPELPSRAWRVVLAALRRLPQGALSRSFGALADTPLPAKLRRPILSVFARSLGIDTSEAELPLEEYPSLNAFFVRKLRPGTRPWKLPEGTAGSPVDGVVGQFGAINAGTLVQAKGRHYTAGALLNDEREAARYQGGTFLTLYLSPRHYHRIHAPCAGVLAKAAHVPGALLPVNAAAVAHVPDLFARNERLLCYIDSGIGRVAVVAVGAYNVGRISAAFDPEWHQAPTNKRGSAVEVHEYEPPLVVGAGDEIMAFHLGSTVVLLFEPRAKLHNSLKAGAEIRLGSPIAS
ncbi:MAG TPA: archaetidylserine decarboxylase [Longimicrobiales bacterium]